MPDPTPPFHIEIEDQGDTALVRCHGKLTANYADLLYTPVSALLPNHQHVILDLANLTHMDSMGLGNVVRLYVHAKNRGTTLELRNLTPRIRDLLILTKLLPAFAINGEGERNVRA